MAYSIELTLDPVRTELQRTGYAVSRPASALTFAALRPVWDDLAGAYVDRYVPCEEPDLVWREPETGTLMLKPSGLRADLYTNSALAGNWVALSGLTYPSGALQEVVYSEFGGAPRLHWTCIDGSTPITGLTGGPGTLPSGMAWVAKTISNLSADEAFTLVVQPFGTATEKPEDLLIFAWGGRHYVALGSNGDGVYYGYVDGAWYEISTFTWGAGMDLAQPFRLTVVPFGPQFVAIVSTGNGPVQQSTGIADFISGQTLLRLADLGCTVDVDGVTGVATKCAAGPLWIAASASRQIGFGIHRCRFAECSFALAPEQLDGPKTMPTTPVAAIGYQWRGTVGTPGYTSDDGDAWDPDADTRLVPTVTLTPSSSGIYTPELWGVEVDIPAVTFTPTHTERDASADWMRIDVRLSAHPNESECHVLLRADDDFARILRLDHGIRVSQDGTVLFDGYVTEHDAVLRGFTRAYPKEDPEDPAVLEYKAQMELDVTATDMWHRLNTVPAAFTLSFTRRSVGAMLEHLLLRCGFTAGQMWIDPDLYGIAIDGWDGDNVWKGPVPDASVGDLIRALIDAFGLQQRGDLRVRWDGSQWRCGFRPSDDPSACFVLDSTLFPSGTDSDRWTAGRLAVLDDPEFHVSRMPYNSLFVLAASSDGSTRGAWGASISPHPRTLSDPTFAGYDGRLLPSVVAPQYVPLASTFDGCAKTARRIWDAEYVRCRSCALEAEFRAGVAGPDVVAWIAGRSPVAVASLGIEPGDPVSLGKWLIEEVHVSIDSDSDLSAAGRTTAGQAVHRGSYTLSFLGAYSAEGFPMFTDVVPEV